MSDETFAKIMLGMLGISALILVGSILMDIDFIPHSRTKTISTIEYSMPENGTWYDGVFVGVSKEITIEEKISTRDWIFNKKEESK